MVPATLCQRESGRKKVADHSAGAIRRITDLTFAGYSTLGLYVRKRALRSLSRYRSAWPRVKPMMWMAAWGLENCARPEFQPNRLLWRGELPTVGLRYSRAGGGRP